MAVKHAASRILLMVSAFLLLQADVLSATSSVVVVGSVFCDACLKDQFWETGSHFIPGAVVAVECGINRRTATTVYIEGETDEYGNFMVEIPSAFRSLLKRCSVRMVSSPERGCNVPSTAAPSPLVFAPNSHSKRGGDETYNAGSFSYRPLNVPAMCYESRSRRAALEEGPHTAPPLLPNIHTPPLPFPLPPPLPHSTSLPLPQLHFPPLPFPFPSAPPAKEGEASKDNSKQQTTPTNIPPLPKFTFPPLPSLSPNPTYPSLPFPRPPPFPSQFPPIPLLSPPPPSTDSKTP